MAELGHGEAPVDSFDQDSAPGLQPVLDLLVGTVTLDTVSEQPQVHTYSGGQLRVHVCDQGESLVEDGEVLVGQWWGGGVPEVLQGLQQVCVSEVLAHRLDVLFHVQRHTGDLLDRDLPLCELGLVVSGAIGLDDRVVDQLVNDQVCQVPRPGVRLQESVHLVDVNGAVLPLPLDKPLRV